MQLTLMPSAPKVERDQLGTEERRFYPEHRVPAVELAVQGAGRIGAEMRRTDPLHAPALLIDQDGSVLALQHFAHSAAKPLDLLGGVDVPLEQDHAPGTRVTQERGLVVGELGPGETADEGVRRHCFAFGRASALPDSFRRPPSAIHRPSRLRRASPTDRPSRGSRCPSLRGPPVGFGE